MEKKKAKYVRIKTAGCDIYPHGSTHKVLDVKDGVYPTFNESDRIPAEWCEEVDEFHLALVPCLGIKTEGPIQGAFHLNSFRRYGFYSDGTRTGFFKPEEYEDFESYMKEHNLEFRQS